MAYRKAKLEIVTKFIFLGSKITAVDGHFSYEIKRCLLLGRKSVTKLDSLLKKLISLTEISLYQQKSI